MSAREKWSNKFDFLFISIGSAVGLGNIWRFPYLCYKNGGGAFMIPYLIALFTICLPQLILQSSLGQFTSRSSPKAWRLVPVMKGLGYSNVVICWMCNFSYATVLAWALRYMHASFSSTLPWMTCGNSWNTLNCFVPGRNITYNNTSTNNQLQSTNNQLQSINETWQNNETFQVSSVTEFWERSVLGLSSDITDIGGFQTATLACLLISWIISFLCMFKGVNWTSKVTYITATLPIMLLFVILIRALTLEGASEGVRFFATPKLHKLLEPQVWKEAIFQNIYSLSIGNGIITALGSFNKYNHNFYRDCFALAFTNACASILSGFVVFSTLGFMAHQQNTTVDQVAESGPGLVFTAYPQALSMMPGAQFWSVIFFLMFFMLGLDSLFVAVETTVANVSDLLPEIFNQRWKKTLLNLFVSASTCLVGLITVTKGGMYYVYLFDNFSSTGWALQLQIMGECIAISWLYGVDRYFEHICEMLQFRPRFPWFKYCWKYIVPVISTILFVYCLALYKPLVYNRTYVFPAWSIAVGWLLTLSSFLWIPGYAIYYLVNKKCSRGYSEPIYTISMEEHKVKDTEELF